VNLYGYVMNDPVNWVDFNGMDWVNTAANFSAGFRDTITFGGTSKIRDMLGSNSVVDECSGFYTAGGYGGNLWQAMATAAVGAGAYRFLEININAFSKDNIIKIINNQLRAGIRIDPAHYGKGWGHAHFWRW